MKGHQPRRINDGKENLSNPSNSTMNSSNMGGGIRKYQQHTSNATDRMLAASRAFSSKSMLPSQQPSRKQALIGAPSATYTTGPEQSVPEDGSNDKDDIVVVDYGSFKKVSVF